MKKCFFATVLLSILLAAQCTMGSQTVAEQYEAYIKRLTFNESDDTVASVDRYGDTLRVEVQHEVPYSSWTDPDGGANPTATLNLYINENFIANKVAATNMDLEIPIVNDKSLNAYNFASDIIVDDSEGTMHILSGNGQVSKKIIGNSSGVLAYEEAADDAVFVWQNGVEQQLVGSDAGSMTERVVSMQDGYVVYESYDDNQNDLYIWKDGQNYDLNDMESATTEKVIAVSDGIIAYQASNASDTKTYIWKDGQSYQIDISDTDNFEEKIVSINDGKVIFESTTSDNSDKNSYVWEDGSVTQLTGSLSNENVIAVKSGVVAYETTGSFDQSAVCVYKDGAITELSGTGTTTKLVAVNDDGSIVYRSSGSAGGEEYLYSWKDGQTTLLDDTVNYFKSPDAVVVKDGKVGYYSYYDDETHAFIYQDGFKYRLNGNEPSETDTREYNERIVTVVDDLVVYESFTEETLVDYNLDLFVRKDNYNYKLTESDENSIEEIIEIKDGIVAYQSTYGYGYGKTDAYLWIDGANTKLMVDDSEKFDNASFVIAGITDGKVIFETIFPESEGTPNEIYCWDNGVVSEIHGKNVNDGQPADAENKIVAYQDGKVYFTSTGYRGFTHLYVWENGMAKILSEGYNFNILGISSDNFYFTNGDKLYKASNTDTVTQIDSGVSSAGLDMNGEVYYNKTPPRSSLVSKWTLSRDDNPYQISDVAYDSTAIESTSSVDAYGPIAINELYAYSSYNETNKVLIDQFTSRPELNGSYLKYSDWAGVSESIIPHIDPITNDIVYTKYYKPPTGRASTPEKAYFEGPAYYDTNNQLVTLYPDDKALEQADLQHSVWFIGQGLLIARTFTVQPAPGTLGSIELLNKTDYDKAFFDDGSAIDIPVYTGFEYESNPLAGPNIEPLWNMNASTSYPKIILYNAIPEGESDSEIYALYFLKTDSRSSDSGTGSGTDDPCDPDDPTNGTIPEPMTIILFGFALLKFPVMNRIIRFKS